MAKKHVRGYSIEDIKVGMKIREKGEKDIYGIINNIEDAHNVDITFYNMRGLRLAFASYCFDKKCEYEYMGGQIEIITE